ncbi:MAG: hypothetical protein LBL24_02280 [Bacteroidales bacterium]|jgi:hypothetical protein|nr:hypothetical protein [Bacteroidales bacterium]
MNRVVRFSMIACLAALLFACGDDDKKEEAPYFGVEAKFLTQSFGPASDTKYVTVKTNQAFTATSSASWCKTERLSAETEENLKISVDALNDVTSRTATVTVACEGFTSAVITVNQSGVQATLTVTPPQPEAVAGSGGDVTLTVAANTTWEYSIPSDATWLTKAEETATSLTLTAEANPQTSPREVAVTFTLPGYAATQVVTVSQAAGFQPVLTVTPPSSATIVKAGGDLILAIEANADWEYDIPAGATWLTKKEETATALTLTAANNALWGGRSAVVTVSLTEYPEYTRSYTVCQSGAADMLDVVFNTDGTANDVSPMAHNVEWINFNYPLSVAYDAAWGRNVVTFNPAANGTSPGANNGSYYRVDYNSNTAFQEKLADGHTFECLVKFDHNYTTAAASYETKFFSTHGSGGTGFLIANQTQATGANGITFLPNVSVAGITNTWVWANSQIKPDGQKYYHLVGIWNQAEEKAYIYVDGEVKAVVDDTKTVYRPVQLDPRWLAIGGDAGGNAIEGLFQGKIVIARIYDKPLTAGEAAALYAEITNP